MIKFSMLIFTLLAMQISIASTTAFDASFIKDEPSPIADGSFIPPNEHDSFVYSDLIKDQSGALISVGSFRTLDRSAQGNYSVVFMLDYDTVMTEFNRLNLELIARSHDRLEYVQRLLGKFISPRKSEFEFFNDLAGQSASPDSSSDPVESRIAQILDHAYPTGGTIRTKLAGEILRDINRADRKQTSLFGSDVVFAKVKERIQNRSIIVVNGSLIGEEALHAIGRAVRLNDQKISAVDLSNSLDHIQLQNLKSPGIVKKLLRNLAELPLSHDAQILFTANALLIGERDRTDLWAYFAMNWREFSEAGRLGYLADSRGFEQLLEKIAAARIEFGESRARLMIPNKSFKLEEPAAVVRNWCKSQMTRLLSRGVALIFNPSK